jgi:hypothetical protein
MMLLGGAVICPMRQVQNEPVFLVSDDYLTSIPGMLPTVAQTQKNPPHPPTSI